MKTFQFLAICALTIAVFAADAFTQRSFTAIGTPVSENFDTLASSGSDLPFTDNVTLSGWYTTRPFYTAGRGTDTGGTHYSFGTSSSTERALGSVASGGPGNIVYGLRIKNNTGTTITSLNVSYIGEQWRRVNNAAAHSLSFDYRQAPIISDLTGSYSPNASLNFATPIVGTTAATALDGNLATNRTARSATIAVIIPPGEEVMLRWTDIDDAGTDHGLAVDDLVVTPRAAGTVQFSAAAYSGLENGGPITFSVTRTGGASGAASVEYGVPVSPLAHAGKGARVPAKGGVALGASTANGGASCAVGVDYITPNGTLNWIDGDATEKTFNITLCPDAAFEPDEVFIVQLTNANGATLGTPSAGNVTILNDDPIEFVVNTNGDEPDAIPGDGNCATAGAVCTLRAAIGEANVLAGTESITFASGITNIEIVSDYEITTPMNIIGPGADVLTINNVGPTTFDSRIFYVAAATVEISGMKMMGGSVSSSAGGGLYVDNANLTLRRVWIADNTVAFGEGAGVINAFGTTTIIDSLISGNLVNNPSGGNTGSAVSIFRGTVNIINTTISGNTANVAGGGAAVYNFGGGQPSTINIVSSTITNNTSTGGASTGGVYVLAGYTVNVQNSIIAANAAGPEDPDVRGAFTSGGYNLIGNVGAASGFTQPTDLVGPVLPLNSLGGSTPLDPMLGPLANNGGPTMTHRPGATSPGIDKGNSFGSTTDQRGFARIFDFPGIVNTGDGADIGAFENLGPTAAAVSVSGNVRTAKGQPIRNAVVTIFGGDLSDPLTVATGSFGSFSFYGLHAGQTYFVMVSAGRYSFAEPVRTIALTDDVDDLDFVAN